MRGGLSSCAALFAAAGLVAGTPRPQALPPVERLGHPAFAVQDGGAVLAGVRRLGADVAFIQLLQYLSSPLDHAHQENHEGEEEAHDHDDHYDETILFGRRFLALSPYFHEGILYLGGITGFVLKRPAEALEFLRQAAEKDPTFWRYRLYAAAIGYRENTQPEKVVALLEEAMKYPDCPGMVMHLLANLHKKAGRFEDAARVYAHILSASRSQDDLIRAARELEKLRAEGRIR